MEIWKQIENYPDYFVSNLGRVKSLKSGDEKILKPGGGRYKAVVFSTDNKPKLFLVHRLVASAFIPNPENLEQVNHKNGNKLDNSILNLEWITAKGNMQHAFKNGLIDNSGENNFMYDHKKYTFYNRKTGITINCTQHELVQRYKAHQSNLSGLVKGRRKSCNGWVLI